LGEFLFNVGYDKHVFSPKPWKEIWRWFGLWFSRKTQKTHTL